MKKLRMKEPKELGELDLIDDFLFNKMMTTPEISEEFGRQILKIILQKDFLKLKVIAQKVYSGDNIGRHGARLDVYLEEEIASTDICETDINDNNISQMKSSEKSVFDIEPDKNDTAKMVKALPKRVRFYHSMIDADCLKTGEDYDKLKRVIVIFITTYDPFGYDYMRYTIKNRCYEIPSMNYDDGAETIFLYTKGKKGIPSEELRTFLQYMEHSTGENASNDALQKIHSMVEQVKRSKEVSLEYMKIFEREQMIFEEGQEAERQNTERERRRADAAEAEVVKLQEEIRKLKGKMEAENRV